MVPEIRWDLQFFAGEKTEQATPKKRREARKKGQVLKSQELTTAILLLTIFILLHSFSLTLGRQITGFATDWFSRISRSDLTIASASALGTELILVFAQVIAPIFLAAVLVGVIVNFLQVGPYFQFDLIQPKFTRINPINGLKRMFSTRAVVEMIKSLLKLTIVFGVAFVTIRPLLDKLLLLWAMPISGAVAYVENAIFTIGWRVGLALLALGIFDYAYQRWEYERNLRMSKQEVKDEYKETEGDPLIKSKMRQRARQMAMSRMMQAVPEADVVITNPTHIAVALKYDANTMAAPTVVAMGQGYLAQKIREIAREHDIVVVENKPLARALFETAEVDEAIPADLYQAVAEVLAFVYRLRKTRFNF